MLKTRMLALLLSVKLPFAFDAGKWKTEADGSLSKDAAGNPIFINGAGQEAAVLGDTITRLNGEARGHRERAEQAEAKLKAFEGIADPAAALAALDTVNKLDQKQLIAAGEVDKVKDQITKQYTDKLAASDLKAADLQTKLNRTIIGNTFAMSPFVKDKLAIPVDFALSHFAGRFDVDANGKITAKDGNGGTMLSAKNMGEAASFEEAIETMISSHPQKDTLLKGVNNTGTGNTGGGGNPVPGVKRMKRAEFEKLNGVAHTNAVGEVTKGTLQLFD